MTETAILAGGCFWGMEDLIRKIPGVVSTEVGYSGGKTANPTYPQVKAGGTGHAECIQVVFDPQKLSYSSLMDFFFKMHDPTTLNRQGNDLGDSYRSAIFYKTEAQKEVAHQKMKEWEKKWGKPIVTEVTPAAQFYPAEGYHQDYLEKNPNGYTCHFYRDF